MKKQRHFARVLFALGINLSALGLLYAQKSGTDSNAATIAIESLVAGRNSVIKGEFSAIEWNWSVARGDGEFARSKIYCAFDAIEGRFRFDRSQNVHVIHFDKKKDDGTGRSAKSTEGTTYTEELQTKYVRLPDRSLHWTSAGRYQVSVKSPEEVLNSAQPFNFNCVGVATLGDLLTFSDLRKLIDTFANQELLSVDTSAGQQELLIWEFANGSFRRKLWLDPKTSYAPTRMEVDEFVTLNGQKNAMPVPVVSIETAWEQINNVWVPIKSTHFGIQNGKKVKDYLIKFNWTRVNESVPKQLFTAAGLELTRFARVVDGRLRGSN